MLFPENFTTMKPTTWIGGSATILEVKNLGCVRGDRRIFSDVNFSLAPGDWLQVTGANGSGKTSLLRILCGLLSPAEGASLLAGREYSLIG